MHISVSKYLIPFHCQVEVVQSCTCKEYIKTCNSWLLSHITIQPPTRLHYSPQSKEDELQITQQISIGLALQPVLTKVMSRAMSVCLFLLGKY